MRNLDEVRNLQLFEACKRGDIVEVRRLIEAGVDVNTGDNNKWTPLHYAVFYGHIKICHILLRAGADVKLKDNYDKTPRKYVNKYYELATILELYELNPELAKAIYGANNDRSR